MNAVAVERLNRAARELTAGSVSLDALRAALPRATRPAEGIPTGIDALDAALAVGGLPRGRLTEVVGATGKLTLLRAMVASAVAQGHWVAYVDASRTLAPRDWAHLADAHGVWIVRPPDASRAAWCADVLLRSTAFSLVVLDSAPPLSRAVAVRLGGLARDAHAALVVVAATDATRLAGATRLRVHRRRQRLRVTIEKGARVGPATGRSQSRLQHVVEVGCASGVARRLCAYPEVPDRRGAARATAGGRGRGRRAATPSSPWGGGMLQHC